MTLIPVTTPGAEAPAGVVENYTPRRGDSLAVLQPTDSLDCKPRLARTRFQGLENPGFPRTASLKTAQLSRLHPLGSFCSHKPLFGLLPGHLLVPVLPYMRADLARQGKRFLKITDDGGAARQVWLLLP